MPAPAESDQYAALRQKMVETQLRARGIRDQRVLDAMARVPRHAFVHEHYREQAYEDHPIPIDEDQTISQPYIVALMLEALAIEPSDRVLEVGTGSGYQTALLAELSQQVYSVERHALLAHAAEAALGHLGYGNIAIFVGDGSQGLPRHAPFDKVVVSAAAPGIPPPLLEQLREGGFMVIPIGPQEAQDLQLVRKLEGRSAVTRLEGCRFVPLIGDQAYVRGW